MIAPFQTGGFVQWAETRDGLYFESPVVSYTEEFLPYVQLLNQPLYPATRPQNPSRNPQ